MTQYKPGEVTIDATGLRIALPTPITEDTQLLVDGTYWVDADGKDSWSLTEAQALAAMLEGMGHDVTIVY